MFSITGGSASVKPLQVPTLETPAPPCRTHCNQAYSTESKSREKWHVTNMCVWNSLCLVCCKCKTSSRWTFIHLILQWEGPELNINIYAKCYYTPPLRSELSVLITVYNHAEIKLPFQASCQQTCPSSWVRLNPYCTIKQLKMSCVFWKRTLVQSSSYFRPCVIRGCLKDGVLLCFISFLLVLYSRSWRALEDASSCLTTDLAPPAALGNSTISSQSYFNVCEAIPDLFLSASMSFYVI